MFGPMIIPTHGLIYIYYKRLWIIGCLAAFLPVEKIRAAYGKGRREEGEWKRTEWDERYRAAFYICMALACAITIGLCVFYSYTWEFQPQGRYILPVLIPFMYLVTLGIGKLCRLCDIIGIICETAEAQRDTYRILSLLFLAGNLLMALLAYLDSREKRK